MWKLAGRLIPRVAIRKRSRTISVNYGPKKDLSVIHKMQQERKRYLDQHALPSNHFRGDICIVLQCQSSGLDPPFWFENS